jgi:hypothetical protein
MAILVLSLFLVALIGGCACVFWAAHGGPRWACAVAVVTLAAGELVRRSGRSKSSSSDSSGAVMGGDSN